MKNNFIIVRKPNFDLNDDLKVEIKYEDRIINKNDISNIRLESKDSIFKITDLNNTGYYYGYVLDKKGNRIKTIKDLHKEL